MATYGLDVCVCEPHSPRQRGRSENHTRRARWWFPRGINLARIAPADAQAVADLLNQQRRCSLNGNGPANLYAALATR